MLVARLRLLNENTYTVLGLHVAMKRDRRSHLSGIDTKHRRRQHNICCFVFETNELHQLPTPCNVFSGYRCTSSEFLVIVCFSFVSSWTKGKRIFCPQRKQESHMFVSIMLQGFN